MRTLLLILAVSSCTQSSGSLAITDMAVSVPHDMAVGGDMTPPAMCNPVDPMSDGQACSSGGCPTGQVAVGAGAECKCWQACDPDFPTVCPCDRRCAPLVHADSDMSAGGACLLANSAGERCAEPGVTGDNSLGCGQGLICIYGNDPTFRYCMYDCTGNLPCPNQTACLNLNGSTTMACIYDSINGGGLAAGATCMPTDNCQPGYLCDLTCKPQCDRPGGTCASGTCGAVTDGTRTIGYVCR